MTRFFKKELPSTGLYLPNGKRVPFKTVPSGVGVIAVNSDWLLREFDRFISRSVGGLAEIGETEFSRLLEGKPKPKGPSSVRPAPAQQSGVDLGDARRKFARGQRVFTPIDSGLRTVGRFIHVLERHVQRTPDDERRVLNAFWSWVYHYQQGTTIPCHVWEYPRSARAIGDKRDLPYLKDILSAGLSMAAAKDDIILLTNDDTVLHRKVTRALKRMLENVDACSSFRMNFEQDKMPDTNTAVGKIRQWGESCLGRDLFAFRAEWLTLNWDAIPDMLAGEIEWDLVFAALVRIAAGVETKKANFSSQNPKCELDRGYVLHQNHERFWMSKEMETAPAKIHNNRLATEFFFDNNLEDLIGKIL